MKNSSVADKVFFFVEERYQEHLRRRGEAKFSHSLAIARQGETDDEKILGLLHDIIEDGLATFEEVRSLGVSDEVMEGLFIITKNKDEAYDSYISLCNSNELARIVKIRDILDNLTDCKEELQCKYEIALFFLRSKHGQNNRPNRHITNSQSESTEEY